MNLKHDVKDASVLKQHSGARFNFILVISVQWFPNDKSEES